MMRIIMLFLCVSVSMLASRTGYSDSNTHHGWVANLMNISGEIQVVESILSNNVSTEEQCSAIQMCNQADDSLQNECILSLTNDEEFAYWTSPKLDQKSIELIERYNNHQLTAWIEVEPLDSLSIPDLVLNNSILIKAGVLSKSELLQAMITQRSMAMKEHQQFYISPIQEIDGIQIIRWLDNSPTCLANITRAKYYSSTRISIY